MKYFLGVDGGGTKTLAVISDQSGKVYGIGYGGNSNHQIDRGAAERELERAIVHALTDAHLEKSQLSYSVFGLAGADRPSDYRIIHEMINKIGMINYEVYNDGLIALKAGHHSFEGMVIICGTATNAIGRNEQGEIHQVGGFGYNFGDFGGGHQLSKEIFRTVIRSYEGRETDTRLTDLVLKQLKFRAIGEMYDYYLEQKNILPLNLAPVLFDAASQKDDVANRLVDKQATELARSAQALMAKMNSKLKPLPMVSVGSVLNKSKDHLMFERFVSALETLDLQVKVIRLKDEPVIGALLLAIHPDSANEPRVKDTIIQSMKKESELI